MTTPETSAVEPDDVELCGVELDGVELDGVELDGVELDGSVEGAAAGRTPHEAHARTMPAVVSSQRVREPGQRTVVVTEAWTVRWRDLVPKLRWSRGQLR